LQPSDRSEPQAKQERVSLSAPIPKPPFEAVFFVCRRELERPKGWSRKNNLKMLFFGEQGKRQPEGPAKVLLNVIAYNPQCVFDAIRA